ncbi:hypothetical protein RHS03_06575, partial [Rhizoctonia solani]
MSEPSSQPSIIVHHPDSFHPSLSRERFDIDKFMGKWHVISSTLPLWKSRSDVTITYSPLLISPSSTTIKFDDIVEYRSRSSPGSPKSRVIGVDTLVATPHDAPEGLTIATSKWQVLGYDPDQGWAVTYFSKTLFTPPGLDIYVRDPTSINKEIVDEIKEATRKLGGEVGTLAEGFFEVPVTE